MKLIIVHNHFRPGGVRRVIELATPALLECLRPRVTDVVLAGGEAPDDAWSQIFRARVHPWAVRWCIDPALGYASEQGDTPAAQTSQRIRRTLLGLLPKSPGGRAVIWAHNQGLGRNLLLTRELARAGRAPDVEVVFHHHDWWFDNRWQRWPEMQQNGFRSVSKVASTIFPNVGQVRHVAINQADARVLQGHFPGRSAWLPNPASDSLRPSALGLQEARKWLRERLGIDGPVWLMPCRLLRRKNIAEALLLTRWLRPEACLVTTARVTSPEEQPYADRLQAASRREGWPLRLSVLEKHSSEHPSLQDLMAASEAVLLTSLQEGFGLSYVEAAVGRRPLIARRLLNIAPDLRAWGLRFPQSYDEVLVHTGLFDWPGEVARQRQLFDHWRAQLPRALRRCAGLPVVLASALRPEGVPFSRLSLTAQLEVLSHPPDVSWGACAPLNPPLPTWRAAAAQSGLAITAWPALATEALSGRSFARRFAQLQKGPEGAVPRAASVSAQREFIEHRLQTENLYPLTWSPNS